MQEELFGNIGSVGVMCGEWSEEVRRGFVDMEYFGEQTWKKLDSVLAENGEAGRTRSVKT